MSIEFTKEWFEEMRKKASEERDPSLVVFMVRDSQMVNDAGLKDLAWAICQNYAVKNDVLGFLELLEEYVNDSKEAE